MSLKVYETIGILNRYITALIDGREESIVFANGTQVPQKLQGRFTTSDKKIQNWIEDSANFNVRYRLVKSITAPGETIESYFTTFKMSKIIKEPEVQANDDLADPNVGHYITTEVIKPFTKSLDDDDGGTAKPPVTEVPPETDVQAPLIVGDDVVNGQGARNYLLHNFKDLTFKQLQNNTMIIAVAKAHNVQFTSWEAFVITK